MTDANEEVLRRSLDAVDRHRTRLLIGFAVGVVVLLLGFYHASHVVYASTNIFVHEVFILLTIWTTLLALVIVIQITVMTKRILRAIELAGKR
jgi:hypothetical protein